MEAHPLEGALDRGRTSLIVDPPTGRLPARVPGARSRTPTVYDDPEDIDLAARCIIATNNLGSTSALPFVPTPVFSTYYQIVQTNPAPAPETPQPVVAPGAEGGGGGETQS